MMLASVGGRHRDRSGASSSASTVACEATLHRVAEHLHDTSPGPSRRPPDHPPLHSSPRRVLTPHTPGP
ncbi:unnamed protein product [Lampetra fluviatilis]